MNAHTQFPSIDAGISQEDTDQNAEWAAKINAVELNATYPAGPDDALAKRFNDLPAQEKLQLQNRVQYAFFTICLIAAVLSLLGGWWSAICAGIIILTSILGVAWGIVSSALSDRDFTGPLAFLIAEDARVATGASDPVLPGIDRADEIGTLARTIEFTAKGGILFRQLADAQKEAAKQQLKDQEKRKQELLDLAQAFETSIGEISSSVAAAADQLHDSAKLLGKSASGAIEQTEQLTDAMDRVAQGSTAAAASSDEFALSIQEISRQASGSAELARGTNEAAMTTDQTVSQLNDRAASIGEIAELIDAIAGRTNLLALNASIEAARGGEAGRGFAVVASEVKELAGQTSRATGDVTVRIQEMQDQATASVNELRTISERIRELEIASVSIATAVDQQSVASKELAMNVDLAASGAGEVSATTKQLRGAASDVGNSATELLSASESLKSQADVMKEKVGDFLENIRRD